MSFQYTRAHHQKYKNVILGYVMESLPKLTLSLFMNRDVGALEGVGLNGSEPNLLNRFGGGLNLFGDELNSRGGELNSLKKIGLYFVFLNVSPEGRSCVFWLGTWGGSH